MVKWALRSQLAGKWLLDKMRFCFIFLCHFMKTKNILPFICFVCVFFFLQNCWTCIHKQVYVKLFSKVTRKLSLNKVHPMSLKLQIAEIFSLIAPLLDNQKKNFTICTLMKVSFSNKLKIYYIKRSIFLDLRIHT